MKTTYLRNKILEHITGKTTYTKPANTYLALFTADPTIAGIIVNEVTGGSYARQQLTWGTASKGIIAITAGVTIPSMPSATVRYWGIMDAATNGNLLEYFPFDQPLSITAGMSFPISADKLKLRDA